MDMYTRKQFFFKWQQPVTVQDAEDAYEMPPIKGKVTFEHVGFSYDETKKVLNDVSFTVNPGVFRHHIKPYIILKEAGTFPGYLPLSFLLQFTDLFLTRV